MTSNELFDLAERKGYSVVCFDLPENKSVSIEDNGYYIGLDYSLHGKEEKERLAHEMGHCEYGGFYNQFSAYDIRGKAERKANKWAFMRLTPIGEIKEAVSMGMREPWELAEHFNVSDKFMFDALSYYRDACGLCFDCV